MKLLIVYHSKTGFTARYAAWLAEATGGELVPLQKADAARMAAFDTVVFASRFHAGRIQKLGWFCQHAPQGARKLVLVTGASPAGSPDIQTAIGQNFPAGRDRYEVFYLPGGLCYEKMGLLDRLMMRIFRAMTNAKRNKTESEQAMAQALAASYDLSRKEYLQPVLDCLAQSR